MSLPHRVVLIPAACLAAAVSTASQQPAPTLTRQALIEEVVIANHILANEGVLDGYGHVSARSPENPRRYFLAAAGAPGLVSAKDITEYDLDSKAVATAAATGYIERFIHGEVYKARPDVMAVVHSHSPEVIPFAATAVPMQPIYHMGSFIGEGVPVWDIKQAGGITDMLVSDGNLGRSLAQTLGHRSAALMRGHGAVIAAPSLHLVVGRAFYLNLNARLQWQAMQLAGGKVTYLDPEEAKKSGQTYERNWDYWKARLPRN